MNTQIATIEKLMLEEQKTDIITNHLFGPGIYMRQITIPADTLVMGHHQNFEQLNILLSGKMQLINDDGTLNEINGPFMWTGKPGRKFAYAYTDCVFMNVYADTETDINKLEEKYITKSDVFLEYEKSLLIEDKGDTL